MPYSKVKPITILMADDDEDDRLLTQDALAESRVLNELHFVEDGVELLEYLERKGKFEDKNSSPRPGLILLDLNMPRMDGREALETIKANPNLKGIPVVILTTSKQEEDMVKDELGEKGIDYIGRMKNAAQRMSNLINDLLEFSRVTTRGRDFDDTDLKGVVNDILSDLEVAIKESNAHVEVGELPVIQADKSQMQQLFLNLLSNAVKFRKPGVEPHISVMYEHKDEFSEEHNEKVGWQIITIKDNGIGFSQEYADKIFVPFQRLHGRSEYKGTGIGLSVCRRIVERHGGIITAHSKDGEGATFIIKLPVETTLFTLQGEA